MARRIGIKADDECRTLMDCSTDELSKRAASLFIEHLKDLEETRAFGGLADVRRTG
jgi:hypothetical protein